MRVRKKKEEGGHEAVVRLLLENGADIGAKNKYGWTALTKATIWRREAVVRLLLENRADIEAKNKKERTALDKAASEKNQAIMRLLLKIALWTVLGLALVLFALKPKERR